MNKLIYMLIIIILIFLTIFVIVSLNTTCLFDGLGVGYYIEKDSFLNKFSNVDINISKELYFRNEFEPLIEKEIYKYAEQNAITYETNSCNGSSYFIKNNGKEIKVSREEMFNFIKEKQSCENCSLLVGYVMGKLILQEK